MGTLIGFVLILGWIILIHEWGHYCAAKRLGVLVHEFSIGMGPLIWSRRKGETQYSIRLFPIGGYVNLATIEMAQEILEPEDKVRFNLNESGEICALWVEPKSDKFGEYVARVVSSSLYESHQLELEFEDGSRQTYTATETLSFELPNGTTIYPAPAERCLETLSRPKQLMVMVAGILVNIIFAWLCLVLLSGWMGRYELEPIVGSVTEGSHAEALGIEAGDLMVALDSNELTTFKDLVEGLTIRKETHDLVILRGEERLIFTFDEVDYKTDGYLGINNDPELIESFTQNPIQALVDGTDWLWSSLVDLGTTLKMLVTGEASLNDLGGMVSIYMVTESALSQGAKVVIYWLALLSLNIGVMNCLPIPPLDGCQSLFLMIEMVRQKELNKKTKHRLLKVGMYLLIGFSLYITVIDVLRYFG